MMYLDKLFKMYQQSLFQNDLIDRYLFYWRKKVGQNFSVTKSIVKDYPLIESYCIKIMEDVLFALWCI